jgi:hypothetical protein
MKIKKVETAEEYLDREFPKGKTKFRGKALVLYALRGIEERERIFKIIRIMGDYGLVAEEVISRIKAELENSEDELSSKQAVDKNV